MPSKIKFEQINHQYEKIAANLNALLQYTAKLAAENRYHGILDQPSFRSRTASDFVNELRAARKNDHDYVELKLKELIRYFTYTINHSKSLDAASKTKIISAINSDPRLNLFYDRGGMAIFLFWMVAAQAFEPAFGKYMSIIGPVVRPFNETAPAWVVIAEILALIFSFVAVAAILLAVITMKMKQNNDHYFARKSFVTTNADHFIDWLDALVKVIRKIEFEATQVNNGAQQNCISFLYNKVRCRGINGDPRVATEPSVDIETGRKSPVLVLQT